MVLSEMKKWKGRGKGGVCRTKSTNRVCHVVDMSCNDNHNIGFEKKKEKICPGEEEFILWKITVAVAKIAGCDFKRTTWLVWCPRSYLVMH